MSQPYFNTPSSIIIALNASPQLFYSYTAFGVPNFVLNGLQIDILGVSSSAENNCNLLITDNTGANVFFTRNIYAPSAAPFYVPNLININNANIQTVSSLFISVNTTSGFSFIQAYISTQGFGFCT